MKEQGEFFQGMVWGLRGSVWDFWNSGEVWEEFWPIQMKLVVF